MSASPPATDAVAEAFARLDASLAAFSAGDASAEPRIRELARDISEGALGPARASALVAARRAALAPSPALEAGACELLDALQAQLRAHRRESAPVLLVHLERALARRLEAVLAAPGRQLRKASSIEDAERELACSGADLVVVDLRGLPEHARALDRLLAAAGASPPPLVVLREEPAPAPEVLDPATGPAELVALSDPQEVVDAAARVLARASRGDPHGGLEGEDDLLAGALADLPELEVGERIGHGATGTVFRARARGTGEDLALKALSPHYARAPGALERFRREIRLLRRLDHPGIGRIHQAGHHRGVYYCAMELVRGRSLADRLAEEGALGAAEAVEVTRQVAAALAHAHHIGVVHRDVKPSNVLIDEAGRARLVDLGLAKLIDDRSEPGLTHVAEALGTPAYMGPELLGAGGSPDPRTDLYALGVMLHELLTGALPFDGSSIPALAQQKLAPLPRAALAAAGVGEGLCRVVERLCAPAKADRYPHAEALLEDLDRVERGELPPATATGGAGEPLRALVVEDDEASFLVVDGLLSKVGYEVLRAADGLEARAALEEQRPTDLVLLDVMLPYLSGMEVLRMLRSSTSWRSVPVLMLSGKSDEADIVRALDLGADDYITKPFRPGELLARVRRTQRNTRGAAR